MENSASPLEILVAEFLPASEAAAVEAQVATVQEPPSVRALSELQTPVYGNDPNELLKCRFLYRGGICLLCGPTGIGKSALLMQAGMHWAAGKAFFGIEPGEIFQRDGMRVLLVQAENDEGDLAEMRNGILEGCDVLSDEEKGRALERVKVRTINDKSGEAFAAELEILLGECGPFDVLLVDPAFAFLGGDSNSQRDVSHFMRELLNPLLQKHQVGMILAHHTNKPLRGKEKDGWAAGDFAYLGAGSAEWINPARAALAIRSIGSDSVFEFRAAKRGRRLRWLDDGGNPTTVKFIMHDGRPGVICWHVATAADIAVMEANAKGGRPREFEDVDCVHAILARSGELQAFYVNLIAGELECGKSTVRRMLQNCVAAKWLTLLWDGQRRRYVVTEKGREAAGKQPCKRNWGAPEHQKVP